MNPESTNKLSIDANQDKPRIIYRDTTTLTTNNNTYSPIVDGVKTVYLSQIKASSNTLIEVYMKDNQTNYVYTLPFVTGNSSGQFVLNAFYTLFYFVANGNTIQQVNYNVTKRGGAITDTYTLYTVVYSTMISDSGIYV